MTGKTKGLGPNIFRPRRQLIAIGIAYETPKATTEAEMIALKALEHVKTPPSYLLDPKKMHPKIMTQAFVRSSEFNGSPSVGCTFAKILEAGRPPSLANAQVIRLLVVMMAVVAKRRQTSGNLSLRQYLTWQHASIHATNSRSMMEPVRLFVAWKKMCSKGPAGDSMTSSIGPATSRRTMRKMKPVKVPMPTQAIMIRGPSTVGLGISE
ncbi:MAG: hypothetical protein Q9212_005512 [Teloschistes hypoglaucus]